MIVSDRGGGDGEGANNIAEPESVVRTPSMTAKSAYHLLAKPAGAACNLGCQYCFFLSKENLYPARESALMPDDVLEAAIKQIMESSFAPEIEVAWQGGEPMLRGLDFFKRSVALAEKHRPRGARVLCEGFKAFFQHIDKPMRTIADLVRKGRFADEIMKTQQAASTTPSPLAGEGGPKGRMRGSAA